jgi:hypothetical protein
MTLRANRVSNARQGFSAPMLLVTLEAAWGVIEQLPSMVALVTLMAGSTGLVHRMCAAG